MTLGYGHDEGWWRRFVNALRTAGYDDVLSIEHEDHLMDRREGVVRSAELLQRVVMRAPPDYVDPRPAPHSAANRAAPRSTRGTL